EYKRVAIELARGIAYDSAEPAAARTHAEELLVALRFGPAGRELLTIKQQLAAGDLKGAIGRLEPFVQAHPEIEDAHYLLAMAYFQPGVNRRKDALAELRRAPKTKDAQLRLGIDALESGDLEAAAASLRAAIELDDRCQEAHYHLALVERERGHKSEAE